MFFFRIICIYPLTCLPLLVLISQEWFTATFVGNTLWLIAGGYYVYINFLGYSCEYGHT